MFNTFQMKMMVIFYPEVVSGVDLYDHSLIVRIQDKNPTQVNRQKYPYRIIDLYCREWPFCKTDSFRPLKRIQRALPGEAPPQYSIKRGHWEIDRHCRLN